MRQFGGTTVYVYSGTVPIAEYAAGAQLTQPNKEYIYAGAQLLATIDATNGTSYQYPDHLSTRVEADASGTVTRTFGHFPFGEVWYETGAPSKWKFTSYERDSESQLDYADFRYYSPRLGRFMSGDLLAGDIGDPQSLARYSYVLGDPIGLIDPLGLDCNGATTGPSNPVAGVPTGLYTIHTSGSAPCDGNAGSGSPGIDTGAFANGGPGHIGLLLDTGVEAGGGGGPSDCRYVDPVFAGIEVTFKFGPAIEAGDVTAGVSMFTKTLGDDGVGSEAVIGFKGLASIQRTKDNAWASGPLSNRDSVTILGFNKDLGTPLLSSSGWNFQPGKEFKFGVQALLGVEIGWNFEKFTQQVNKNRACGY